MNSLPIGIAADWRQALQDHDEQLAVIGEFLRAEIEIGRGYLPGSHEILRAFEEPMDKVRVLLVGQDPYPTPGHAMGLSFSVAPGVRPIPRSLANIYREYVDDLGLPMPRSGDLTPWARSGVLLLNRVLTVSPGVAGSHRGRGWEEFTQSAIDALVKRGGPLVAVLWGRDAAELRPRLGDIPIIESVHPSPLSAHRGFFGSRPFTTVNEELERLGSAPVNWHLP